MDHQSAPSEDLIRALGSFIKKLSDEEFHQSEEFFLSMHHAGSLDHAHAVQRSLEDLRTQFEFIQNIVWTCGVQQNTRKGRLRGKKL